MAEKKLGSEIKYIYFYLRLYRAKSLSAISESGRLNSEKIPSAKMLKYIETYPQIIDIRYI
jgi:hypothetical protein